MENSSGPTPDWRPRKTGLKRAEFCQWTMDNGNGAAQEAQLPFYY